MRKFVVTYGLIAGGILSIMMCLTLPFMDRIGFDRGMIVGYTTMVIAFMMIYFGVRAYRESVGGRVSFGRALKVGVLIMLIATVCYVATWQVIYHKFIPDFPERMATHAVEKERKAGASPEAIAAKEQEMADFTELYRKPLVNIAFTFLEPLPVGLVFTLLTAGLLSRKPRDTDSTAV